MDLSRIKKLEKNYWAGKATLEEEQELNALAAENNIGLSDDIKAVFNLRKDIGKPELGSNFDANFWEALEGTNTRYRTLTVSTFMRYAAIGVVLFGIGMALWNIVLTSDNQVETPVSISAADTYSNPEAAFEETRRALMFASEKLNKGKEPMKELKRFYSTRVSISGVESKTEITDTLKNKK